MASHEMEVRIKPRLDAVVVRPGDKLIIRVSPGFTVIQRDEYVAHLQAVIPGVEPVFVPAEQLLVYRPDGALDA